MKMDIAVDAGSGSNSLAVVQQSFCLSMIVRNEAERLVQALDSALPFIQHAVIVDTGSVDDTVGSYGVRCNWSETDEYDLFFIVLPGNYYKVYYDSGTGGTIDYWVEWS